MDAPAEDIAERALRINLSDLAAMGAEPRWFTLALTLPQANEDWLSDFSRGLWRTAREFNCTLVGGDTTAGPLSITLQVMGALDARKALRRDGASAGDYVLVTHTLGDGAAGLAVVQNRLALPAEHRDYLRARYYRPTPRLQEGALLRGLASAALDISDGLLADLGHICAASDLAAVIEVENLPLSPALHAMDDPTQARNWALGGGDDYELCFTVAPDKMPELGMLIASGQLQATVIGQLLPGSGVRCELHGQTFEPDNKGYTHF
jgi:thiamine-monophosphate kinase